MSSSSESVQSQKNTRGHLDLVQGSLWNSLQLLEILWHLGHCCEQGWELAGELRPVQPRGADAPLVGQLFSASPREKNIQLCAQQCVGWGASWSVLLIWLGCSCASGITLIREQALVPERGRCVKSKECSSPLLWHKSLSLWQFHLKEEMQHLHSKE